MMYDDAPAPPPSPDALATWLRYAEALQRSLSALPGPVYTTIPERRVDPRAVRLLAFSQLIAASVGRTGAAVTLRVVTAQSTAVVHTALDPEGGDSGHEPEDQTIVRARLKTASLDELWRAYASHIGQPRDRPEFARTRRTSVLYGGARVPATRYDLAEAQGLRVRVVEVPRLGVTVLIADRGGDLSLYPVNNFRPYVAGWLRDVIGTSSGW